MKDKHRVDWSPIPEQVLYVNEPQFADRSVYDLKEMPRTWLDEDFVRVYVPLDLSREEIIRRLQWAIERFGAATEDNEFSYSMEVSHILEQAEVYNQIHWPRNPELVTKLMEAFVSELEAIPEGDSECFPYDLIEDLKKEYLTAPRKARTVHLRLEIPLEELDPEEIAVLKRYGKMDDALSRDILVPSTMTLHALHYAIQRLFGWQNSHLHHFTLPEELFRRHTGGLFGRWADLCGVYFRMPSDDYEDRCWDDDYREDQNFDTWLRRKYRGPYRYGGEGELMSNCRMELQQFRSQFRVLECHPFQGPAKTVLLEQATLRDVNDAVYMESDWRELLERLTLEDIFILDDGPEPKQIVPGIRTAIPLTRELLYRYDYGDDWNVRIRVCSDSEEAQAHSEVAETEKPICLARDGASLLDDVGGLSAYCRFLEDLHQGDREEQQELKVWARSMGWTGRLKDPARML